MKKLVIAVCVLLSACEPSAKKVNYPVLPDELKDCKIFEIVGTPSQEQLVVVRCPNAQVSTFWQTGNYKTGITNHTVVTL